MHGIFAASTGFSVQFFPESAILGCGPDAARAYPYTMVADGTKSFIKIEAPDHPLSLGFRPDGWLDAGFGPYHVHGRAIYHRHHRQRRFHVRSPRADLQSGGSRSEQDHPFWAPLPQPQR